MKGIEPLELHAKGMRFGIVVARFNAAITERLLEGARDCLSEKGVLGEDITVVRVPGSFELPLAAKQLGLQGSYDAILCLGALIRGETSHFEWIASAVSKGLVQVSLELGVPVMFGVLTTESEEQALARVGGDRGHKGVEVAEAAIEMVHCLRTIRGE